MVKYRNKRRVTPIHESIKSSLGYNPDDLDTDVYEDWKIRKSRICKPCWELKYCPYGPFVEQSPILPPTLSSKEEHNYYLQSCLKSGMIGQTRKITDTERALYEKWLNDEQVILKQAYHEILREEQAKKLEHIEGDEKKIEGLVGGKLPPIHIYRTKYEFQDPDMLQEDFEPSVWDEILNRADNLVKKYECALSSGVYDDRKKLDSARRAWFQDLVDNFNPDDYPKFIPDTFAEASCNVFGHICPVFFAAEELTETEQQRRIGRRALTFEVMMRIVRRDDYRCQHCKKKLLDNEVEFDHIIPISKGGSSEEHNIRLTCFEHNRDKGDTYVP